jgi:hypothetical protein
MYCSPPRPAFVNESRIVSNRGQPTIRNMKSAAGVINSQAKSVRERKNSLHFDEDFEFLEITVIK